MRIAVLGSNSFAGRDFIDLLMETGPCEVLGISRSPQKSLHGDLRFQQLDLNRDFERVRNALDEFCPQYIVNYAAQGDDSASWAHPDDFFETNCVALARLVQGLRDRQYLQRFLQVSSSSVYGSDPRTQNEDAPLDPDSPYGVSKAAADLLLLAYYKSFAFPAQIIRPPNLYGPQQDLYRIIPKTIISLKKGQPIALHGGGYAVRSYLHVRDASRAALAILQNARGGVVFNVSPDGLCRVRDLVAIVCELMGKNFGTSTQEVADRPGQQSVTDFDSKKIRRELGWSPQIALRDGIKSVIDRIEREWVDLEKQHLVYTHKR